VEKAGIATSATHDKSIANLCLASLIVRLCSENPLGSRISTTIVGWGSSLHWCSSRLDETRSKVAN
jgi:hypothetical protein